MKLPILLLGCLLASCLTKACSKGSLGNDAGHDSNDALSDDAGHDPDVSHDPDSMDLDAEGELDADAFEPHEVDCILPVRDCGSGCRQVTCAAPVYFEPRSWDVYGSKIAYFSRTGENGSKLLLKDLESENEYNIIEYPDTSFIIVTVSIFESIFVYEVSKRGVFEECESSINVFNLDTFVNERILCYVDQGGAVQLDHYQDNIVWEGIEDGETDGIIIDDLFLYNIASGEKTRLTERESRSQPNLWGDQFVFWGNAEASFEVFLWDLNTMEYRNITRHPSDQWEPDIWQNRVVWTDHRNAPGGYFGTNNSDIYWCDLPDCIALPATTNGAAQESPTIAGDWIAWIDYRNDVNPLGPDSSYHDQLEIWGYNISTGEEYQLVTMDDTVLWGRLRIENEKLYFTAPAGDSASDAIFELDLSQFLR